MITHPKRKSIWKKVILSTRDHPFIHSHWRMDRQCGHSGCKDSRRQDEMVHVGDSALRCCSDSWGILLVLISTK